MLTSYNVISEDGFIADKNGNEDFIPDTLWINFLNLCKNYGSVIMGRKTYQTIQKYDKELLMPFEELSIKKIVVTSDHHFIPKTGYIVAHSPEEAMILAPDSLLTSGPALNNYLSTLGYIKKVILHVIPVSIGEGIKPFTQNLNITMTPVKDVPQIEGITVKEFMI